MARRAVGTKKSPGSHRCREVAVSGGSTLEQTFFKVNLILTEWHKLLSYPVFLPQTRRERENLSTRFGHKQETMKTFHSLLVQTSVV